MSIIPFIQGAEAELKKCLALVYGGTPVAEAISQFSTLKLVNGEVGIDYAKVQKTFAVVYNLSSNDTPDKVVCKRDTWLQVYFEAKLKYAYYGSVIPAYIRVEENNLRYNSVFEIDKVYHDYSLDVVRAKAFEEIEGMIPESIHEVHTLERGISFFDGPNSGPSDLQVKMRELYMHYCKSGLDGRNW